MKTLKLMPVPIAIKTVFVCGFSILVAASQYLVLYS